MKRCNEIYRTQRLTLIVYNFGKINIIPQDIGPVLLNLFNNAFWTVAEKQKKAGTDYEPSVTVSTKKLKE